MKVKKITFLKDEFHQGFFKFEKDIPYIEKFDNPGYFIKDNSEQRMGIFFSEDDQKIFLEAGEISIELVDHLETAYFKSRKEEIENSISSIENQILFLQNEVKNLKKFLK